MVEKSISIKYLWGNIYSLDTENAICFRSRFLYEENEIFMAALYLTRKFEPFGHCDQICMNVCKWVFIGSQFRHGMA